MKLLLVEMLCCFAS
jgi:hypothetical protein